MRTKKYRLLAAAAALIAITGFSACLKDNNVTPQRYPANILFVNAFLGTNMDVYDDTQKLNTKIFSLTDNLLLHQPYTGYYSFTFKKTGADSVVASTTAFRYDSTSYYTILIYGDSTHAYVAPMQDDFENAKTDRINIRFFHLSPNTPAVDLYLGDTKVDSNVVFRGGVRDDFSALNLQLNNPKLVVKLAGTSTVVAQNDNPKFPISVGNVYTIMLTGFSNRSVTDDKRLKVDNTVSYY